MFLVAASAGLMESSVIRSVEIVIESVCALSSSVSSRLHVTAPPFAADFMESLIVAGTASCLAG